jgi:hypothetical protein
MVVGSESASAVAALLLYFPLALLVLALWRGRLAGPLTALFLAGAMFLPERIGFDLPGLPVVGKEAIVHFSLLLACALVRWRWVASARPGRGIEALALVLLVSGVVTGLLNGDRLRYGPTSLPAIPLEDLRTGSVTDLLRFAVPVFLGRCAIRDARDLRSLTSALAVAGLVYSFAALIEIRLSPQLHRWTYGFHPDLFAITRRFGGYRPWAYMINGLALAIFLATALLAAVSLARARLPIRTPLFPIPAVLASFWLAGVLVACKSVAAMVTGLLLSLALAFLRIRALAALAVALATFVLVYPLLRALDAVPLGPVVALAGELSPERARSLAGRIETEDLMLAKARERLAFGWGEYRRNWVFDPTTGKSLIVPDGFWIITLSSRGVVGFAGVFGLYAIPVFLAARRLSRIPDVRTRILVAGLMLMIAMRMADHLPNGFFGTLPLYLAGALAGLQVSSPRRRPRRRRRYPAEMREPAADAPAGRLGRPPAR